MYHVLLEKYTIINIFSNSFDAAEFILMLSKIMELILISFIVTSHCIMFQEFENFLLFKKI